MLQVNSIDSESVQVVGTEKKYDVDQLPNFKQLNIINFEIDKIGGLSQQTLYKYFSIDSLSYLLQNQLLYMEKISSWEDPYENFFIKSSFQVGNKQMSAITFAEGLFGQSWTTLQSSDAMWRIYSHDKRGVRIRTNAEKLFRAIYIDDSCMACTWYGKVQYGKLQDFENELIPNNQQGILTDFIRTTIPQSLFMKRDEFNHEQEFRVAVSLSGFDLLGIDTNFIRIAFEIDVDDFIEEYCLDPRLTEKEYTVYKRILMQMGAKEDKIRKSTLYEYHPRTYTLM